MADSLKSLALPAVGTLTMWALDKFGPEDQVWAPYVWAAIAAFLALNSMTAICLSLSRRIRPISLHNAIDMALRIVVPLSLVLGLF